MAPSAPPVRPSSGGRHPPSPSHPSTPEGVVLGAAGGQGSGKAHPGSPYVGLAPPAPPRCLDRRGPCRAGGGGAGPRRWRGEAAPLLSPSGGGCHPAAASAADGGETAGVSNSGCKRKRKGKRRGLRRMESRAFVCLLADVRTPLLRGLHHPCAHQRAFEKYIAGELQFTGKVVQFMGEQIGNNC